MECIYEEPHFNFTINENEINEGAIEIVKRIRPSWPLESLNFKVFTNGITNKLIGVWYPGHYNDMILVRVYGHKTDLLINRKHEIENIRIMHKAGYTHCIYATFQNGFAYQFLEGDTLTIDSVRQPQVYCLVAKRMAQMHKLEPNHLSDSREPFIWNKIEKFMSLMPKHFSDQQKQSRFQELIKSYDILEKEYSNLKRELPKLNNTVVYAHNDLLLANILFNEEKDSIIFIDYEYAAYNYQAFDIANHFAEFAGVDSPDYSLYPNEKLQKKWLKEYLSEFQQSSTVCDNDIAKLYMEVNKFLLLTHFFWGCWALIQSQHSHIEFDFLEYAAMRFNEYFRKKDQLYKTTI